MQSGFHKLSRREKISALSLNEDAKAWLNKSVKADEHLANCIDKLSENTIAYYHLPMGIAPNVLLNGESYFLPLVTEESSVVAAIAKAAKFWSRFGGFHAQVLGTEKKGQVHFFWYGNYDLISKKHTAIIEFIELSIRKVSKSMQQRGGGVTEIKWYDKTSELDNYFQLDFSFETLDAMGANFINSVLEKAAKALKQFVICDVELDEGLLDINMSILSNYTPQCRVKAWVSCTVSELNQYGLQMETPHLAQKMVQAFTIANMQVSRAVTHNKGIFNGIDALTIATGNDWRAVEAGAHAYASKSGKYQALSEVQIKGDVFTITLEIPLSVGIVGGVTQLHPLAKVALQILKNPSAELLMQLIALSGLASNFSAIVALTTAGIQKGHMKMHLSNMLLQLNALPNEISEAEKFFANKTISHNAVEGFINVLRSPNNSIL